MAQQNLDLYYPQILDKHQRLLPLKVSDALKRAFDMIYRIDPPAGSLTSSSLTGLNGDNISDVPADKLSSGTVNVGVQIVLSAASIAHPSPAKLIWENTGAAFANTLSNLLFIVPLTDKTNFLNLGSDATGNVYRWKGINILTSFATNSIIRLQSVDGAGGDSGYRIASGTGATNHVWSVDAADMVTLDDASLSPATTGVPTLGTASLKWKDLFLTNPLKVVYGGTELATTPVDGQLLIGKTSTNKYVLATLTGTANQVIVTNGSGAITLSLPQSIGTGSGVTFDTLTATTSVTTPTVITAGDLYLNAGGVVKFGTHTAIGAEVLSGFITVKDSGGVSRKVAVIA